MQNNAEVIAKELVDGIPRLQHAASHARTDYMKAAAVRRKEEQDKEPEAKIWLAARDEKIRKITEPTAARIRQENADKEAS